MMPPKSNVGPIRDDDAYEAALASLLRYAVQHPGVLGRLRRRLVSKLKQLHARRGPVQDEADRLRPEDWFGGM